MTDFEVKELVASVKNIYSILILNRKSIQVDIFMQDTNNSSIINKVCPHIHFHILPKARGDYRSDKNINKKSNNSTYINLQKGIHIMYSKEKLYID